MATEIIVLGDNSFIDDYFRGYGDIGQDLKKPSLPIKGMLIWGNDKHLQSFINDELEKKCCFVYDARLEVDGGLRQEPPRQQTLPRRPLRAGDTQPAFFLTNFFASEKRGRQ